MSKIEVKPIWSAHYDGICKAIHYPECWDTMAYPDLESALSEIFASFQCTTCTPFGDKPTE